MHQGVRLTRITWGKLFPYQRRPGESLLAKCARLLAEREELRRLRAAELIDFTEPRRDE